MSAFNFERYRELYGRIFGLERQIDALHNRHYQKVQNSPPITEKAAQKAEAAYAAERDKLYRLMDAYKSELDELVKQDVPEGRIRPGSSVLCHETNSCDTEYEENYKVSEGELLDEDRSIQEMYGCGIKLITPYDDIGRALFGKAVGEEYSYTINGYTTKGVILKVN